jgi:hypothetical protein
MGCKSHTNVTDIAAVVREKYTTHGLHLNFRGNMRVTDRTAESIHGHVQSMSGGIPVITHVRASPFFSIKPEAQRCLTYTEYNNLNSDGHGKMLTH